MRVIDKVREKIPYAWKRKIINTLAPSRYGIETILKGMNPNIKTVFDIGANNGWVSLLMLYYFPSAEIYSFEPCSKTYEQLKINIENAGYTGRSHPFKLGFFNAGKTGTINITTSHAANSILDISKQYGKMNPDIQNVKKEQITLLRMDDFVAQNNIKHIDLVKIDVEGVERQVLEGGEKTFKNKVDTVIMEVSFVRHPYEKGEYIRLQQLMHDYGFVPYKIFDVSQSKEGLAQFDCVFRKY